MIYEIESLDKARKFLNDASHLDVTITNPEGSTRYYGMRIIDEIFQTLKGEFPNKISGFIVNTFDDFAAYDTAVRLGYNNVRFNQDKFY